MKAKMKNKILIALEFIFIVALLTALVSAAGIASPYWKDYPLYMNYGETKVVNFNLQNMVGEDDITVKAEIKEGGDIASLETDTYTAKAGTHDTMIPVTITIPKDYDKNLQRVKLEVTTVASDQEGMITLGTTWTTTFNVILSDKPVERSSLIGVIIGLVIAILIALVIILFLLKKRRR